ncbi:glycosyltransferase family 1 protein [Nocardioides cavernae]|uniref:Glycosyltransferase family 1 protein n=1 Tax=Nocardioides cavernae TaxID=1921566 RepID=A0ABR8NC11_9ACTN|nr:glycosyltransferase [Nocardioides cavernae]MBD3925405.1 glycosyltransferase family 1 protein [Nocardioides cavernae]MBM7514216.1 UDP:flavonoid glycosyltransferase YjiC (YdhE family) [Nocardioides cavernae]
MKVVVAALPAFGHVYPLVPLALALERAGATVVFATGEELGRRLPFRTVVGAEKSWAFADAISELARRMEGTGVRSDRSLGRTLFVELCAPHVTDVMTAVLQRERPDLVVFEQTNVGAAIAAHRTGIRAVCQAIVGWGRQWSENYEAVAALVEAPSPDALAEALIDPHPPFLADLEATPPFPTVAMRPTPWSPEGHLPPWLLEPRRAPRVYVTMGTVFGNLELLRTMALEVAATGCEALVATGPGTRPGDLGDVPATVHVEQEVPQVQLLPHVDVVVHHGGTGTIIGALGQGLPQVVVPQGADQFWNADHITAEGAGRTIPPGAPPGSVGVAVAALAEDEAPERAAARRLGDVISQMPSPDSVAELLIDGAA